MLTPPWDGEKYETFPLLDNDEAATTGVVVPFGPTKEDFYMTQFRGQQGNQSVRYGFQLSW
jgi:hypothetical protein